MFLLNDERCCRPLVPLSRKWALASIVRVSFQKGPKDKSRGGGTKLKIINPFTPLCLPSLDYSKQILGRFESIKRKNAIAAAVLHEAFATSKRGWMTQYFLLNFLKIPSELLLFNILTGYWIDIDSSAWKRFNHPADFSTKKMCLLTTLKFRQERFKG